MSLFEMHFDIKVESTLLSYQLILRAFILFLCKYSFGMVFGDGLRIRSYYSYSFFRTNCTGKQQRGEKTWYKPYTNPFSQSSIVGQNLFPKERLSQTVVLMMMTMRAVGYYIMLRKQKLICVLIFCVTSHLKGYLIEYLSSIIYFIMWATHV